MGTMPKRRVHGLYLAFTSLISLVAIAGVLWSALFAHDSSPLSELPDHHEDSQYSRLHPEAHAFRGTTSINLEWHITSGLRRPDGVLKEVFLINDNFPGPTIEARSGDRIIVHVENGLANQSVSIHWHGLSMRGYNRMDGAAGVTQAPIAPGETFTYDFVIEKDQHGTFWYHAHDGVQRGDGLYGGLVVHEPQRVTQKRLSVPPNEYLLLAGDWYHRGAQDALEFFSHPGAFGNEAVPDSILVNGHGAYRCDDAVAARPVDCETRSLDAIPLVSFDMSKRTLVRVVNVGSYAGLHLNVPGASLEPLSVDGGQLVQSQVAHSIGALYPGERVDILVHPSSKADATGGHFTVSLHTTSFRYSNPALTTAHDFPLIWTGLDRSSPLSQPSAQPSLDLTQLRSRDAIHVPSKADQTFVLYAITQKLAHLDNQPLGFINSTTWRPQSSPEKPLVELSRSEWDAHQFVPHVVSNSKEPVWVDIVLNNLDEEGHPFHFHGYDFWVLSTYSSKINWGSYNPYEDDVAPGGGFDLAHAIKKDTVYVPRRGYAVLRFRADNLGIWMFHCHVLWHQASGMAMAVEVTKG